MATVTIQYEYSTRLMHFIQKLEETDSLFHDVTEKRAEAINNLYHYGVTESKELGHNEAINLIRKTVGCSRASVYRYLPESVKRKYHPSKPKSLSLRHSLPKDLTLKKSLPKSRDVSDISISFKGKNVKANFHFGTARLALQQFGGDRKGRLTVFTIQILDWTTKQNKEWEDYFRRVKAYNPNAPLPDSSVWARPRSTTVVTSTS